MFLGGDSIPDAERRPIESFFTSGELAVLPAAFNAGSYLAHNPDIRRVAKDGIGAITHFLHYGRAENRLCVPLRYNARFLEQMYRVRISSDLTVDEVVRTLRDQAKCSRTDLVFLNEEELLCFHDVNVPYVSQMFDHEYYAIRYLRNDEKIRSRARCLIHFCEVGQFRGHDIAPGLVFDTAFYAAEYGVAPDASEPPFLDWIRGGSDRVRWPNLRSLAKAIYDVEVPPHLLDPAVRNASRPESSIKPSGHVARLIEEPLLDAIVFETHREAMAAFYAQLGDRLAARQDEAGAATLYDFVLRQVPNFAKALTSRAELAQRTGDVTSAIAIRERMVAWGVGNAATFADLGACYAQLGDRKNALRTLTHGVDRFPGDSGLRRRLMASREAYFEDLWRTAASTALTYGYPTAQALVREAAELCSDRVDLPPIGRTVRTVAIYGNCDLPQCKFYRVDQKVEQLAAAGYEVRVYDYVTETDLYLSDLSEIDLVIVYRVPAFPYVIQAIQRTTALGIVTIYDIDDLVFDQRHFPPALATYSGQLAEADHASMACGVSLFAHAPTLCRYGMVSTRSLAPFVEASVQAKTTFVHPNGLSLEHEAARAMPVGKRPGKTTIFYGSGTKAHKADFIDLVEPALLRLFEVHGEQIQLIVIGDITLSPSLSPWRQAMTLHRPIKDLQTYWDLLKLSDINLSVLEKNVFNDGKSEIKWLEAAIFGIPSVVSASATHEEVIVPGETGYLYRTSDELFTALDALVRSPGLRQRIGRAAEAEAMAKYNIDALSRNLGTIIEAASPVKESAVKRLTIVNVFYPPQAIGGATRVVHDNVLDLKRLLGPDWQIDVICTREGGETPYEIDWYVQDGIRVFCITAADHPRIDHLVEDPRMARAFAEVIEIIRPHLVHFHCIQRLTASCLGEVRKRAIPFAVTMHDGWWISPHQFLLDSENNARTYDFSSVICPSSMGSEDFERSKILRRYLRGADRLLTVSEPFARICRQTGLEAIAVIENGVSRLPPPPARTRSHGRVRLAHIGGLAAHKGYHLVRNIFLTETFSNLSLLLVDHAMQPGLQREEIWNGTPVLFRGKAPQSEVAALYDDIDVLLAASIWPESYGLVSREALAMGCWVVASDRGAIGDCVVDRQNGYVVDVGDAEALIAVLRYIDANPDMHRASPALQPAIRTAREQAEDLAALYAEMYRERHG
ncbi:glycosyltransferase [Methylobacterium sp. J-068]|uniref:glycosyltransferase n=1 Tax=Methylobacterium sp. J-068 TaxID=2836649 RepID=UPI001FBADF20|nr:glycosyltransferase [Methylobacterium sp. J-068]MCJ2037347.1 glycosyltransferase [Methylobacterium sp. J-068]